MILYMLNSDTEQFKTTQN